MLGSIEPQKDKFHVLTGDFNTLAPGELMELRRLPPRLRFIAWATGGRVRYKTIQENAGRRLHRRLPHAAQRSRLYLSPALDPQD